MWRQGLCRRDGPEDPHVVRCFWIGPKGITEALLRGKQKAQGPRQVPEDAMLLTLKMEDTTVNQAGKSRDERT